MLYVKQTIQRSNSNVAVYTPGTDVFNTSLASSHIINANLFIRTVKLTKITNQIWFRIERITEYKIWCQRNKISFERIAWNPWHHRLWYCKWLLRKREDQILELLLKNETYINIFVKIGKDLDIFWCYFQYSGEFSWRNVWVERWKFQPCMVQITFLNTRTTWSYKNPSMLR